MIVDVMKSDMETKSLVGDSPSGSGTTFILIFIVTVIIVNFISKVFAGKSKLSLSEFYDRILEFFSLTWFFTKQMFGDAEGNHYFRYLNTGALFTLNF